MRSRLWLRRRTPNRKARAPPNLGRRTDHLDYILSLTDTVGTASTNGTGRLPSTADVSHRWSAPRRELVVSRMMVSFGCGTTRCDGRAHRRRPNPLPPSSYTDSPTPTSQRGETFRRAVVDLHRTLEGIPMSQREHNSRHTVGEQCERRSPSALARGFVAAHIGPLSNALDASHANPNHRLGRSPLIFQEIHTFELTAQRICA